MNFIKLHEVFFDNIVYVNINNIALVYAFNGGKNNNGSKVCCLDQQCVVVSETPEEIMSLIEKEKTLHL